MVLRPAAASAMPATDPVLFVQRATIPVSCWSANRSEWPYQLKSLNDHSERATTGRETHRGAVRLPQSSSRQARHVPLSDGAINILDSIPRTDCKWTFPNPKTQLPYVSIFCSWNTARKHAGLADVRMHDLRHSFASLLINSGRTLYEVQKILGHTQVKTTQRYAHLSHDTLLDASNAATRAIGHLFQSGGTVPLVTVVPSRVALVTLVQAGVT